MPPVQDFLRRSPLCQRLGLTYPIVQAGMGGVALGALAGAVSKAGGLGVIGAGFESADQLRREIRVVREITDRPFGVNILFTKVTGSDPESIEVRQRFEQQIAVVFEEKVPVLVSGLGNPGPYVARARAAGMMVMAVIGNVAQAKTLEAAGADAIVAQGMDGGGHVGRIGTAVLVPAVVDAVRVPVLAAGGLADGRGLLAALALGAAGVWMGTRFLASTEAAVAQAYKDSVVAAGDEGTVVTRCNTGKTSRLIKNAFTESWRGREAEIKPYPHQYAEVGITATHLGMYGNDPDRAAMPAGQSVALIHEIKPAADILRDIVTEAEQAFERSFARA